MNVYIDNEKKRYPIYEVKVEGKKIQSLLSMKKAELVFIPAPGIGHLVSTVEFAKRLIDRDDRRISITILVMKPLFVPNTDTYTKSLASDEPRIQLIDLPRIDPPPLELTKSLENYVTVFIESHRPHVKDVVRNLIMSTRSSSNSVRVAGLVLDLFCSSMVDVGNELDLPSYLFFTSGLALLGLMLCLPTRHDQIGSEFSDSEPELILPGFVNSVPTRVLPSSLFNKDGGYATSVKLAKRFRDAKGIIVNTFSELECYTLDSFSDGRTPPIYTVGPVIDLKGQVHQASQGSHPDSIIEWLDDQPPSSVVFLCFGSMGTFGAPQLREIAHGLERSGHRFLWSMRQPPKRGEIAMPSDCTDPEEILPDGFIERTKGKGVVSGWVPQVEVLAHKSIGGFVSHCGWNSILESVWHGVPIVTWPMYAEQQLNAFTMVKELGLAVEMRLDYRRGGDDVVMADEIERAVRRVMSGDIIQVRQKVKEMGEKSRRALMDGGSSFNMIGRLVEDILFNI